MLAVVFAALALPIALFVFGFRQMSAKSPAPESPELRASLELAAEKCMPAPTTADLTGARIVFPRSAGDPSVVQKRVESAAAEAGGNVLTCPGTGEGTRLIVQVPSARSTRFERDAFGDFAPSPESREHANGLYEVMIPMP